MPLKNDGNESNVENGDDKNKSGNISKDTINWNPSMLCILDAMIKPIPIATNDVKIMKTGAKTKSKEKLKETPKSDDISRTIKP